MWMSDSIHAVRQWNGLLHVADFFCTMKRFVQLLQGLCSGKWVWSALPPFFLIFFFYVTLLSTATEISKSWQLWWRTITKNWIQVVWGCDRHCVQTFVLWYCANKNVAFFWIFFSLFVVVVVVSPHRGSIAISSVRVWKWPEPVLSHLAPWLFFFKVEISPRTLIPLFRLGSVHIGSASWDDSDPAFPDELRVSSFPDRFPHYAWMAA